MRLFSGELVRNIPQRGNEANRPVRPPGVVPQEPVHEGAIERGQVVRQEVPVPCNERLGEGPVEPLDLGLHLWRAGVGVEVHDACFIAVCLKVIGKLAPVVRLHVGERKGCNLLERPHEVGGMR